MPFLPRVNFTKPAHVNVHKAGRKVSKREKWGSSVFRDSRCYCLTFSARLPSIPLSPNASKLLFLSLWSLFSPFPVCTPLPQLFSGRRLTKIKPFFGKKSAEHVRIKKRENWKWKDVHEILRVTAAALCNSQSISVIVHKYVHACSRICMHLYIFIYLSSFARSSWKMPLCEKNRWQFFGCFPVPHLSTGMLM